MTILGHIERDFQVLKTFIAETGQKRGEVSGLMAREALRLIHAYTVKQAVKLAVKLDSASVMAAKQTANIDEMPAGREMDGQIHILIFNKAVPTDHDWLHNTFCDCVPQYSTDDMVALQVAKVLAQDNNVLLEPFNKQGVFVWVGDRVTKAPTLAVAICRAALKVVLSEKDEH